MHWQKPIDLDSLDALNEHTGNSQMSNGTVNQEKENTG
jgi:hypothetical protein